MKIVCKDNHISVVGELDRFQLENPTQFVYPQISSKTVEIDLAKTRHVDTAGLAWLLKIVSFYQGENKQVNISHLPDQLIALAQLSNVLALLPITKTS